MIRKIHKIHKIIWANDHNDPQTWLNTSHNSVTEFLEVQGLEYFESKKNALDKPQIDEQLNLKSLKERKDLEIYWNPENQEKSLQNIPNKAHTICARITKFKPEKFSETKVQIDCSIRPTIEQSSAPD